MSALKISIEGLPAGAAGKSKSLILVVRPRTVEAFEAVVEAAGGPGNFTVGYRSENLHGYIDGGSLQLYPPPGDSVPEPVGDPYIRAFGERIAAAKDGGGS